MSFDLNECRCPTCGAVQNWQDECRRCHSDLSALKGVVDEIQATRLLYFRALLEKNHRQAKVCAERLVLLSPSEFHQRLMAVSAGL